jgi:diguanylate cyclase
MTRLRVEAETDALTGLLNQRGFLKAAAVERSVAERIGLPLAIVVIDLDHFKEVNDSEGHVAGDRVLAAVSAAWRSQMRAGALLCRFGGDEFVMLLADSSEDAVQVVLDRCRHAHPIEWTAGITNLLPSDDFEQAIRAADAELYRKKMQRLADRMPDRRALG